MGTDLVQKVKYAELLSCADIIPRHFQGKPGNVLVAIEYGYSLGIAPIQALSDVYVVNGKPAASANLLAALVRKAGHKLRIEGDDEQATATLVRSDDPDYEFKATWTIEKAKKAFLLDKAGPWHQYPGAMLRARAISEVVRMGATDALMGVAYTPEEIGVEETETLANLTWSDVKAQEEEILDAEELDL